MSESMCRALRDGALVGQHAPALTIKDSIICPFGFDTFTHVLCNLVSNILAGKSQAHGLVLIAFTESPSFYFELLRSRGMDIASSDKWIRILDCYSDPLGWKDGLTKTFPKSIEETRCKDVRDLDNLFSAVFELGKGMVGQGKDRFSIAIDSVTVLLRHAQLSCLARFINNLRSHEQVSSVFWLIQTDLHDVRTTAVFEYMSSLVASLEPLTSGNGQRCNSENLFILEEYSGLGKLHVRMQRQNGRVKIMCEDYILKKAGITFIAVSSRNPTFSQSALPKVQFNLQLSERERTDRENVVLPFEHQGKSTTQGEFTSLWKHLPVLRMYRWTIPLGGTGKDLRIYDGRRSLSESASVLSTLPSLDDKKIPMVTNQGKGEIHYLRDSDDEQPDSDEDPDDDLDI